MKTSFITTFINEEKNIKKFIESILKQTKKVDEIILVDGGSTDKTYDIIKEIAKKNKKIKIFQKKGNIAEGRNFAISKSKGDIILVSDAGCIVDKNWAKEILKFYPKYDVVVGNWEPYGKNIFEKVSAEIVKKKKNKLSNASSRSLSFKKSYWKRVGGYPEDTYTGEDTKFNLKLKDAGANFAFAKKAIVKWKMRPTWKKFAKQFYLYGKGDGKTKNIFKMKLNLIMFLGFYGGIILSLFNPLFFILQSTLLFVYGVFWGIKMLKKFKSTKAFFWGFINSITKRIFYLIGVLRGVI